MLDTVAWGNAAHAASLDGAVWISALCNTDRAYVMFGDRVSAEDPRTATDQGQAFTVGPDRDWLVDLCACMKVDVLSRTP